MSGREQRISSRNSAPRAKSKNDQEFEEFKEFKAWKKMKAAAEEVDSDSDVSPPRAGCISRLQYKTADHSNQPVILVHRIDEHGREYRSYEPYQPEPVLNYSWVYVH